jgi:energy-coupling factor transporter ATP-binding protein EcfA2
MKREKCEPRTESLKLVLEETPPSDDFTIYVDSRSDGSVEGLLSQIQEQLHSIHQLSPPSLAYSVDCTAQIVWLRGRQSVSVLGRVIACRCFRGCKWSLTVRLPPGTVGNLPKDRRVRFAGARSFPESNFAPPPSRSPEFLCSFEKSCRILGEILNLKSKRTGLILITGATGSGKSNITRGLIYEIIRDAVIEGAGKRRPHVITFEDPVEIFYEEKGANVGGASEGKKKFFDYTPREKGFDADSLRDVFRDALRQTPTLVFVGEIRDRREWEHVIEFAGTGHTVIATAHAGSLAESWGKILSAVNAHSSADRSDVADRILGIIHLRPMVGSGVKGAVPACWVYTLSGAKSLMADGRSSLVPTRGRPEKELSSFGRVWFIERVQTDGRNPGLSDHVKEHWNSLYEAAFLSDLEGV